MFALKTSVSPTSCQTFLRSCLFSFTFSLTLLVAPRVDAFAADLGDVTQNGVTATLSTAADSLVISVSGFGATDPAVFSITDPTRVVIDLPGVKIARNNTLTIAGNPKVTAVRLGCHLDKTRIVVDLTGTHMPRIGKGVNAGKFVVTIDAPDLAAMKPLKAEPTLIPTNASKEPVAKIAAPLKPAAAIPTATAPAATAPSRATPLAAVTRTAVVNPTATMTPTATKTATATPTKNIITPLPRTTAQPPTATPIPNPTQQPQETKSPPSGTAQSAASAVSQNTLSQITFDFEEPSRAPTITLSLSQRARYTLTKASDRTYRLIVPDSILAGEHLALPLFPPQDFNGFTVVRAQQVGTNVELMIGIERGNKITPTIKDSQILIKGAPKLALRP